MEIRRTLAAWVILGTVISAAVADPPKTTDVWLDVDTGTGIGDVDDGLMLVQAFHSPEVAIRGISVVFGNAPLEDGLPIARDITKRFGPPDITPAAGAASAEDFGKVTPAVTALAAELERRPLTILAVGPVTNVGTLVKLHPELHGRIARVVVVAGRRPGQRFENGALQKLPHRDFNFELDPAAMQAILDTEIDLVLAPWEVSSHVWISRADLAALAKTGGSGAWIAETSDYWIERWEKNISPRGFNPFDTLALGWVTHPELIASEPVSLVIEQLPDDRAAPTARAVSKPYLIARPAGEKGRAATYCYRPRPAFKQLLIERLSGRPPQPK